ncbi:MAG: hypothetical protein BGO41_12120 [Clostridiales bacterium 38-18]|nr:MAG: hypothetical protein BGO41_12120 [Clostridiales bacterium 38-18]
MAVDRELYGFLSVPKIRYKYILIILNITTGLILGSIYKGLEKQEFYGYTIYLVLLSFIYLEDYAALRFNFRYNLYGAAMLGLLGVIILLNLPSFTYTDAVEKLSAYLPDSYSVVSYEALNTLYDEGFVEKSKVINKIDLFDNAYIVYAIETESMTLEAYKVYEETGQIEPAVFVYFH